MAESSATASLRIRTTPETVDALAESFERLLAASKGVVTASKALSKEKAAVARGEKAVASSTKDATRELRSEAGAARNAADANDRLSKSLAGMKGAIAGGVAGFLTLEAAKKVFGATSRAVTSSIAAFAQESSATQSEIDQLASATTGLQVAFGRALVGGDRGQQVFAALRGVVVTLTSAVVQNAGAIQDLATGAISLLLRALPAVVQVIATGVNTVNVFRLAWIAFRVQTEAATEAIAQLGTMIGRGLLQLLAAASTAVGSLSGSLAGLAEAAGLDSVAASLQRGADATGRFAASVTDAEAALGELSRNSAAAYRRSLDEYGEAAREIGQNMVAVDNIADNVAATLADLSARFDAGELSASDYAVAVERVAGAATEAADAIKKLNEAQAKALLSESQVVDLRAQRLGIEQALLAQASKAAELEAMNAEREAALAVAAKSKAEADARALAVLERRTAIVDKVGESLKSTVSGIATAIAEGGQNIGKMLAKMLGDILVAEGSTQIALGAINLIPPPWNPKGNPVVGVQQIAVGGAAVAAGVGLGAAARGGGGQRGGSSGSGASAPVATVGALPAPSPAAETYIFNNTANFGFVTDPEASAAAFTRAASGNRRLGY